MAAGEHPLLPPLHVGEPLRPRRHRPGERAHPAGATSRASRSTPRAPRTRRRSGPPAASTSSSSASARPATSASTSRAPAPRAAPGWSRSTRSRGATPRPTSSARRTCRARRSRWASPRSSRRARSPSSPPASTRRPSCAARSRARSTSRSPPRSCSGTRTRRSIVDAAAAAELTRVATPWLLDEVEWTPELDGPRGGLALAARPARRSSSSPQRDYAEHQLSSLVARHGSPGAVNGDGLQRARREDPRALEAAARPAGHLLLAASRRRRDLDGRHPAQAGRRTRTRSPSPT